MSARKLAIVAAAAFLAGCAANPSIAPSFAPVALSPERASDIGRGGEAPLEIRVRIPRREHHHSARYLSPATKGMTLALAGHGGATQSFGLTPQTNKHCKSSGGATSCSITVLLPSGHFTANVSTYDEAPVHGRIPSGARLLSADDRVPLTIRAGKRNRASFTLDGVPASFTIGGVPAATANTAFSAPQPLSVQALDADGYTIVGAYDNAVTLSDSDASGATTLATAGADNPPAHELLGSSDAATLNYSGLAIVPATITASAKGAVNATATFTPALQPIGPASLTGGVLINQYGAATQTPFTASEPGWTNAPYSQPLTATLSSACGTFVTVAPSSGTAFTATLVQNPTNATCTLTLSDGVGQTLTIPLGYEYFAYTGAQQTFVMPVAITEMTVLAAGAQGGGGGNNGSPAGPGGKGGTTFGTIPVLSGPTLYINVGGAGGAGSTYLYPYTGAAGFNGGGLGSGDGACGGGGGGGGTDVRNGGSAPGSRVIVAGGGGGAACSSGIGGPGGAGGSSTFGGSGANGVSAPGNGGGGGGGGTSSTVGAGGGACDATVGSAGVGGTGGDGGAGGGNAYGTGGGGGGYYGGGGGGGASLTLCVGTGSGGGGGGSSFLTAGATQLATTQGTNSGNGFVVITW